LKIDAPIAEALLNQHGVAYVGFGLSLADTVARYAAIAHLPIGHNILTVESKINYLAPAKGGKLCAVGRVIRPGAGCLWWLWISLLSPKKTNRQVRF
jgi:uncharacterized protein (TIGR00369 family)